MPPAMPEQCTRRNLRGSVLVGKELGQGDRGRQAQRRQCHLGAGGSALSLSLNLDSTLSSCVTEDQSHCLSVPSLSHL